jgi:hypothetical protein
MEVDREINAKKSVDLITAAFDRMHAQWRPIHICHRRVADIGNPCHSSLLLSPPPIRKQIDRRYRQHLSLQSSPFSSPSSDDKKAN